MCDAKVLPLSQLRRRDIRQWDYDGVDWSVAAVRIVLFNAGIGVVVQRLHFSPIAEKGAGPGSFPGLIVQPVTKFW